MRQAMHDILRKRYPELPYHNFGPGLFGLMIDTILAQAPTETDGGEGQHPWSAG